MYDAGGLMRGQSCNEVAINKQNGEYLKMNLKSTWIAATCVLGLTVVSGVAISGQDRYTLKLPGGVAFSDFKGYGDWQLISSAETDDRMKVILGNPTIIAAFKAGIPGNGQPFPEGSKMAKVQWKPKKSTEAPFSVNVPDTLADLFFMEKDSKRFPQTGGWGYAQFDYDPASATFSVDKAGTPSCGQACHVAVKAKDYVFHPYEMR
jgi:Cytochrome P460